MTKPTVLIAGAGIGGLAAGLALIQRGFAVKIFEQAPKLEEVGAGLQLAADGTKILIALGLREQMEEVVCEASGKEVRLWNTGERRKLFDLGEDSRARFGAPYWFVHRADLHFALKAAVDAADSEAVITDARCTGFEEVEGRVRLDLQNRDSVWGDVLVGADGVHSCLRDQMFASPKAEFTGMLAWRGLARTENLPKHMRDPIGTNWVGPGGHVITYPLRRGELMNFVGIIERDDWTVESWSTKGTKEECARDFEGWHPEIHDIIQAVDQPFKWALVGRDPLQTWSKGRATVLGDAAHPTLPFLAHGAIMALEDAFALARCLDEAPEDPITALRRYEATRVTRATDIVNGAAANATRFHNEVLSDPRGAVDYLDNEWAPEKVRQRYDWLFEYDMTTAPLAAQ